MTSRFILLAAASTLLLGGCIFGPSSSNPNNDSDASDSTSSDGELDVSTDADADAGDDDPPCVDCVGTWAGTGVRGAREGARDEARFDSLADLAVDADESTVYLADSMGHRIWSVRDGQVMAYAGTGECSLSDGAEEANDELCTPGGLHLQDADNLYVTECDTDKIKRVEAGTITWVAGSSEPDAPWEGPATEARLECPSDITSDTSGIFYIAGNESHRIHEFTGGQLSVLAGGDPGYADSEAPEEVRFRSPTALVHDPDNERLIVLDRGNHCLRGVSLSADTRGATTTLAGECETPGRTEPGPASGVRFDELRNLELDGDLLYVITRSRVVTIDFGSPELGVRDITGLDATSHHADGPTARAKLHGPTALAPYIDAEGNDSVLITESEGRTVRKWKYIDPADDLPSVPGEADGATVETVAGTGLRGDTRAPMAEATFAAPFDIVRYNDGYLIADRLNHEVLLYRNERLSVFAGNGECQALGTGAIPATDASLCEPVDLYVDDQAVYIVDRGHHALRSVESGMMATIVGSAQVGTQEWEDASWEGPPLEVKLKFPAAVTIDANDHIYIAGGPSHVIHRLNNSSDEVEVYAGNIEDPGSEDRELGDSKFRNPRDIISVSDSLFVADYGNHCVRQISNGRVNTALGDCGRRGTQGGPPEETLLDYPLGLLSSDYDNDSDMELIVLDRVGVSILDGDPVMLERVGATWEGWRDGALDVVGLTRPTGVVLEDTNSLLITERDGDRLRRISF